MKTKICQKINKIRNLLQKLNPNFLVILFFFLIFVSPGPIYTIFIFLAIFLLNWTKTKDIHFSLISVYLISLFFPKPLFQWAIYNQDYTYFSPPILVHALQSMTYSQVIITIIILCLLINGDINVRMKKVFEKNKIGHIFLVSLLLPALLIVYSLIGLHKLNFSELLSIQDYLIFPVFILVFSSYSRQKLEKKFFIIFSSAMLFLSVVSLKQMVFQSRINSQLEYPITLKMRTVDKSFFRSIGTFSHPNYLGTISSMLLCFFAVKNENTRSRKIDRLLIFVSFFTLILSLSRWSIILGSTMLILILSKSVFLKKPFLLFILVLIPIIIFIWLSGSISFLKSPSFVGRIEIAKNYMKSIKFSYSTGLGAAQPEISMQPYRFNFDKYKYTIGKVHNHFLQVFAENGIIFVSIYMLLIIQSMHKMYSAKNEVFILSVIYITTAYLLNSIIYSIHHDNVTYLFYVLLAAGVVSSRFKSFQLQVKNAKK